MYSQYEIIKLLTLRLIKYVSIMKKWQKILIGVIFFIISIFIIKKIFFREVSTSAITRPTDCFPLPPVKDTLKNK